MTLREELKNSDVVNCDAISHILDLELRDLHSIHWNLISAIPNLPKDFIYKYRNSIYWRSICIFQKFTEYDIKKFANYIWWDNLQKDLKLSENLIEELQHKICWKYVSCRQKLSCSFIEKFEHLIEFSELPLCYFNIKNKYSWQTFL